MPTDLNVFRPLFFSLANDERITVWHLAVLFGIIRLAKDYSIEKPIEISRKKVIRYAHINSIVTYHRCIKELQLFGYIEYLPSYHPGKGSTIFLKKIGM